MFQIVKFSHTSRYFFLGSVYSGYNYPETRKNAEAIVRRCSAKKWFLKNLQGSQEKTSASLSL